MPSKNNNNQSQHNPQSTVELISVEQAKEFLKNMIINRPVNTRRVEEYATRIRNGEWKISDPLKFDINEQLYDGQHRLLAQLKCGCSLTYVILRGMPLEASAVCDTGQARTPSQIAVMAGIPSANKLFPVIKKLLNYSGDFGSTSAQRYMRLFYRYREGLEFADEHFINVTGGSSKNTIIHAAIVKGFYYENHLDLIRLLRAYCTGMYTFKGDNTANTMAVLVNRYNSKGGSPKKSDAYYTLLEKLQKGINLYCQKVEVSSIRATAGDLYPLPDFIRAGDDTYHAAIAKRMKRMTTPINMDTDGNNVNLDLT